MTTELLTYELPSKRPIVYALAGNDKDKPTVLLSNSLTAPLTSWDRVVSSLIAQGFRVLRYNQPGHGGSGVPSDLSSTTFESFADDVRNLLNHLSITKLHAWVGVSMGAATGVVFAAKYPDIIDRLAVCDTISCSPANAGVDDAFGPRVAAAREAGKMDGVIEATLERWFGQAWMNAHADETSRMRELMAGTTIDGFQACCAALRSKTFDLRPLTESAGKGVQRALFVVGEKDANLPETMQELRDGVEKGLRSRDTDASVEFHVVKNAGHVCYVDGFDEFISFITAFLS